MIQAPVRSILVRISWMRTSSRSTAIIRPRVMRRAASRLTAPLPAPRSHNMESGCRRNKDKAVARTGNLVMSPS